MNKFFMEMHREFIEAHPDHFTPASERISVLDVGSRIVKGQDSIRSLIDTNHFDYTGVDIVPGPGVDIVLGSEGLLGLTGEFDVIFASSVFEHCDDPFELMHEIGLVLRHGGIAQIVTPLRPIEHCRPDNWRIMPDGFRRLVEKETKGLLIEKCEVDPRDKRWTPVNLWLRKPVA